MSDIKSDMKTFTVREMHRETASVLKACDREGAVRIQHRNGRIYTLKSEPKAERKVMKSVPDFRARIGKIFPKTLTAEQTKAFDRLLAGE